MKPGLYVHGMLGIGDCLHQRAPLQELMKTHDVTLRTFYAGMYHDLVAQGLRLDLAAAQAARIRDPGVTKRKGPLQRVSMPSASRQISYNSDAIHRHGSILAAQYASLGLKMPADPDFSMPVDPAWTARLSAMSKQWNQHGKPLLVYRPIVLNTAWFAPARAPDPRAYAELYASIREQFFVVSVAHLGNAGEYIVGPEQDVDVKLHRGELDFELLAALFWTADMVFACPGFAPVLAQAVGTPNVCVYGGNESFRTTNSVGAHLAPTLAIEPDKPCECHDPMHKCDKTINMDDAAMRMRYFVGQMEFAKAVGPMAVRLDDPRVLIFTTTFLDTPERVKLFDEWLTLHRHLNPTCDFLVVDTWPKRDRGSISNVIHDRHRPVGSRPIYYEEFTENIGHLARGGRDGWGRAFSCGLHMATHHGYDYAVHIEGDSMLRRPVMPIVLGMRLHKQAFASVPVAGTRSQERNWIETGLMFMNVSVLRRADLEARYDWRNRNPEPNPEAVMFQLIEQLGTKQEPALALLPFKAERGDRGQITVENVATYDWITHVPPEVSTAFLCSHGPAGAVAGPAGKLNFGCGENRLKGWQNYDYEVNIAKRLPFADRSADFILAEHVVEHIEQREAFGFFEECRRILKPGGVLRVCVPSIAQVQTAATEAYIKFASRWAKENTLRGAMRALITEHGHRAIWAQMSLKAALYAAGFEKIAECKPGESEHDELFDVDGHHLVIGEEMNRIETIVCEAS